MHPVNALGKNHLIPLLAYTQRDRYAVEKRNIFSLYGPKSLVLGSMFELQKEKSLSITISSPFKISSLSEWFSFLLWKSILSWCDLCKNSGGILHWVETESCSHTWRLRNEDPWPQSRPREKGSEGSSLRTGLDVTTRSCLRKLFLGSDKMQTLCCFTSAVSGQQ